MPPGPVLQTWDQLRIGWEVRTRPTRSCQVNQTPTRQPLCPSLDQHTEKQPEYDNVKTYLQYQWPDFGREQHDHWEP
jgi:hypothetical protein